MKQTININIERLAENITIKTDELTPHKIRSEVTKALLEAINDTTEIYNSKKWWQFWK